MCACWTAGYCGFVENNNGLVPDHRESTGWPGRKKKEKEMKTTIKQLLDPRQQTKGNTTSSKGKESEMKNRMISKKAILGLAIGTGLIAGFSVLLSGSETRAFNPAETVNSVNTGMVIDESQEIGGI